MLKFMIASFVIYKIFSKTTNVVLNKRSEKLGYVIKGEKANLSNILLENALIFGIPFLSTLLSIFSIVILAYTNKTENMAAICEKSALFYKAEHMANNLKLAKKRFNPDAISDVMKLDGVPSENVKPMIKMMEKENLDVSDKKYRKIMAMNDAELWLEDIRMNVGLTDEEKRQLYMDYVKEFMCDENKVKVKAPQKTLKMIKDRDNLYNCSKK